MFDILIPETELWDESKEEFIQVKETKLKLEHSLVAISKWEAKYHKPYISKQPKTNEEIIYYIKCMTITQNVKPEVYLCFTKENIEQITEYIDDPMTATVFSEDENNKKGRNRFITSELIYCWMTMLKIPVQFEKWHINRLLTLIRVCNIENSPKKKMSNEEIMSRNIALNEARKKKHNIRG